MSNLLDSHTMDDRETHFRSSFSALLESLQSYKNELARQERKLEETRALMLDQLTDSNTATVIRNLTKRLRERDDQLEDCRRRCVELEEQRRLDETELQAKSRHIEKLSSLLLTKEEKLQELERDGEQLKSKIGGFEDLVERRNEACEKWRKAAHEAAGKMREQLNTLKATEEMNQELRDLLDQRLTVKTQEKVADSLPANDVKASSDVLTEEEIQELVTSFTTPQTTAVVSSLPGRSSNRRSATYSSLASIGQDETPDLAVITSTLGAATRTPRGQIRAVSPSVARSASPRFGGTAETRPASPAVEAGEKELEESVTEVVVRTVQTDDHRQVKYIAAAPQQLTVTAVNAKSPSPRQVWFQLDDVSQNQRANPVVKLDAHIPYPAPIPNFSAMVTDALEAGRIHDPVLWKYFIRECVHFYYDLLPTTDSQARNSYFNIGRTLYEKYPIVAKEGPNFKTPWTYFNTCLSSRLRNERFAKRRLSEKRAYGVQAEAESPMEKRGRVEAAATSPWREGCRL